MPYQYAIDPERELVVIRASGSLDVEDVERMSREVYDDPDTHRGCRILVDFSEVAELDLFHDDVLRLADLHGQLQERIGRSRIAIFAPRDAVYGVGRMWHSLQPDWEADAALFRTRPEALAWLGIPPDARLPGARSESPRRRA